MHIEPITIRARDINITARPLDRLRQAEFNRQWMLTEAKIGAAWDRYAVHKDAARYRREMAEIKGE